MRRILPVLVLIVCLFMSFWHEKIGKLFRSHVRENIRIGEVSHSDDSLAIPQTARAASGIFADTRQSCNIAATRESKTSRCISATYCAAVPGQNSYPDDGLSLEEWGIIILHLPRNDG